MILTDIMTKTLVDECEIIQPYQERNQQPASYDLTIANIKTEFGTEISVVNPGETVLIGTIERVNLPDDVVGFIKDKSSFLRAMCSVGQGFVDPGYCGDLTVQFKNNSSRAIALNPGMPFCQIVFEQTSGDVAESYNGHYQDSDGIVPASPNVLGIGGAI